MPVIYKNGYYYGQQGVNGHVVLDANGLQVQQRDSIQFGSGLAVVDDDQEKVTDVAVREMTQSEMDEILAQKPLVPATGVLIDARGTEYVIGDYITVAGVKKPLYQKTLFVDTLPASSSAEVSVPLGVPDMEFVVSCTCFAFEKATVKGGIPVPYYFGKATVWWISGDRELLVFTVQSNMSDYSAHVNIQYTKTTD